MRRTAALAAETRSDLLRAAITVFARRGYAAATLAEIGAEAGVTRGAFYHHFRDKSEIYNVALAARWTELSQELGALLIADETPAKRIRRYLTGFYSAFRGSNELKDLLSVTMGQAEALPDGAAYDVKTAALTGLLDQLTEVCTEAQRVGELRRGVDSDMAGRVLLAQLTGVVLLGVIDPALPFGAGSSEDLVDGVLGGLLEPDH